MKKLILLMIISIFANAEYCAKLNCITKIEKIYTEADGNVYIGTTRDEKLANCSPVAGVYFTLDTSSKNSDLTYSTLLSAFLSNKMVNIRIVEGSQGCKISYIVLDSNYK
jgi:hypothetical protein